MSRKQHGSRALPWAEHERGPWHDAPRAVLGLLQPNRQQQRRAEMARMAETWASCQSEWAAQSQLLSDVLTPTSLSQDGEGLQHGPYRVVPSRMTVDKNGNLIFSRAEGDARKTDDYKEEVWIRSTSDGGMSTRPRELHVVTRYASGAKDGEVDAPPRLDSRFVRFCRETDSVISPRVMMDTLASQNPALGYPVRQQIAGRQMNVGISQAEQGTELIGGVLADLEAVGYLVRVAPDSLPG